MRHFKRFPEHSPPNLNDGSDTLKAVTVTLEDGEPSLDISNFGEITNPLTSDFPLQEFVRYKLVQPS